MGPRSEISDDRSVFLDACRCLETNYTPVWIMRQAGRYLPQYRKIREKHKFLDMCKNPRLAAEVTLQPVEFLGVDAAILFSDIMLILEGMGADLAFADSGGPVIGNPIESPSDVKALRVPDAAESTPFVFESIKIVNESLNGRVPLIGFSGAPFTLASYMIEGGHSRNYLKTKKMMYNEPAAWNELMGKLVDTVSRYLAEQVRAGVKAVQVFDSWIGCLSPFDYDTYVMEHMKRLFENLIKLDVPAIHFGTDTATLIERLRDAGGDVIGVDWRMEIDAARERIGYDRAIQGNLDPTVLFASIETIRERVENILDRIGDRPGHIFNLGHGVLPKTPPDNVKAMVDMVHELSLGK